MVWGRNSNQSCESLRDDNEYLRDENERLRQDQRDEEDRRYELEQSRRREREQARWEELQYATEWTEAFEKAESRFGYEAREEAKCPDPHMYFTNGLKVIGRAKTLYEEEMKKIGPEIAELEAKIEAVRQKGRNAVAAQLETEFTDNAGVSAALRENDPNQLVCW